MVTSLLSRLPLCGPGWCSSLNESDATAGARAAKAGIHIVCDAKRQLRARADAELAEDARQVGLDRALGDIEVAGDLAVRATGGGQRGDASLRISECIAVRGAPAAAAAQLGLRALLPRGSPELPEHRLGGFQ
jgi:hypothetical protein